MPPKRASAQLDPIISRVLLVGVVASALIVAAGFILFLATSRTGYPAGVFPVSPADVVVGVLHLRPFAVIDLGLFLLILTPVFRVAIGIVGFALEGDRNMVAATTYILCMLILSFLLGKAGG